MACNLLYLNLMIRLSLTPSEMDDIAEALDDPDIDQRGKLKLIPSFL